MTIVYPYSKAICQDIVHVVPKMEGQEITFEALPSDRGDGALGSKLRRTTQDSSWIINSKDIQLSADLMDYILTWEFIYKNDECVIKIMRQEYAKRFKKYKVLAK